MTVERENISIGADFGQHWESNACSDASNAGAVASSGQGAPNCGTRLREGRALDILLIDDDDIFGKSLSRAFGRAKPPLALHQALTWQAAIEMALTGRYELVLVDIFFAGQRQGFQVVSRLRRLGFSGPILTITGWSEESEDRFESAACGADGHLLKGGGPESGPGSVRDLHGSICFALAKGPCQSVLRCSELEVDLWKQEARVDGEPVELTWDRWRLLVCLIQQCGRVVGYAELHERTGTTRDSDGQNIRDLKMLLCKDLGRAGSMIEPVRGVGYGIWPRGTGPGARAYSRQAFGPEGPDNAGVEDFEGSGASIPIRAGLCRPTET